METLRCSRCNSTKLKVDQEMSAVIWFICLKCSKSVGFVRAYVEKTNRRNWKIA